MAQSAAVNLPLHVAEAAPEVNLHWPYLVFALFAGILALSYGRRQRAEMRAKECVKEIELAQR